MRPRTRRAPLFDDGRHPAVHDDRDQLCLRSAGPLRGEVTVPTAAVDPRLDHNGHTERRRRSYDAPTPPAPPANAGPLGLTAFSITTFLLSMVNAGLIAKGAEPVVFGVALMVGGLAQVLVGMWEFRAGNTFAG